MHVVHDLSDLNGLCKEYDSLKSKLEDQVDDYIAKRRRHKKIKRKKVLLSHAFLERPLAYGQE